MGNALDLVVVGGGIVGLAHALAAADRGWKVAVLERDARAVGASCRNFGMVWPIGQPAGERLDLALRSRELWLSAAARAGFWIDACGSLHLARREDEARVLHEFLERLPGGLEGCEWWTPTRTVERAPGARPEGLLGALHSPHELCVDPREAVLALTAWLVEAPGVEVHPGTSVVHVEPERVRASDGREWRAERVLVASGSDLETLFPEALGALGLTRCKLQMMRTVPQPDGWRTGPHLAGGLTLRHYESFASCPGREALARRVAEETPELDRHGIHVMVSQNGRGEAVLGDSHEYGAVFGPDCSAEIDELVLRELRDLVQLPDWTIAARWYGVYARHPREPWIELEPAPGVRAVTALGGAGMTLSLGLAERGIAGW